MSYPNTQFPDDYDVGRLPLGTDELSDPVKRHSYHHQFLNHAVLALQQVVGKSTETDPESHERRIADQEASHKLSVRLVADSPKNFTTDFQDGEVVDGMELVAGDRILIAGQLSATQNGIYIVNTTGAPTRATDADQTGEIVPGTICYVREGLTYAKTFWACAVHTVPDIGVGAMLWVQVGGEVKSLPTGNTIPRANFFGQLNDGWVPPVFAPPITGRYYDANSYWSLPGYYGTGAVAADRLYAIPMMWPTWKSVDRIAFEVTGAIASSNGRAGIYVMSTTGLPGSLIVDGGEISTATTGVKEATISVNLRPGWYFLALLASHAITVRTLGNGNAGVGLGKPDSSSTNMVQAFYHAQTYGALPSSFPLSSLQDSWFVPAPRVRAA